MVSDSELRFFVSSFQLSVAEPEMAELGRGVKHWLFHLRSVAFSSTGLRDHQTLNGFAMFEICMPWGLT